jgi:Tol biopolymer transport system component
MSLDGSEFLEVGAFRGTDYVDGNCPPGDIAWSPDGASVLYSEERNRFAAPADGSSPPVALGEDCSASLESPETSPDGTVVLHKQTSPDGTLVAYGVHTASGNAEVWVAPADNPGAGHKLVDGFSPSWSPDSLQIVFTH